ncbi:family 16 glycosylhydrolase [Phenylobacterium sp. LjRoot225]|uniref:family 16 glycosylhydrolase n=1 Tax=Phenylobacterium sp. LjRoot225 TaxID=3342285 RepID=UPI003F4FE03B
MATGYTNYSGVFLASSAAYGTTIWAGGSATITAGASPTRLMASGLGDTLRGGVADDTLGINNLNDKFTGGGGVDTVFATVDVRLTSDVENLTMDGQWAPVFGIANDGANIVEAVTANVTVDAKGGDDVIVSFGQRDTFLFAHGSGRDILYNFHTGAIDSDVVGLTGYGLTSFASVVAAMTQVGSDVRLTLSPTDLILFKNTTISAFTAQNFDFAVAPSKITFTDYNGAVLAQSAAYQSTIWANGTAPITAGSTPTRLMASGLGDTLLGGAADDTFGINNLNDHFTGGGGIDTAIATVNVILPNDVENLSMDATWSPIFGIANNGANVVKALTANVTLNAKGGDDVIFSFGKNDTLIFEKGSGRDAVYNFHTGAADGDVVRLIDYGFNSFADVKAAMTQTGADVVLTLSATDAIRFKSTTLSAFTADNFQVSIDPSKLKLTFADEFNSLSLQNKSAGGGIWATSYPWAPYDTLSAHQIKQELEVYVDPQFAGTGTTALGLNPFSVSNGVLTITPGQTPDAMKPLLWNMGYTSGLLTTTNSFAQTYGYFEMRADLPDATGAFPAFWLLPADGSFTSETDIVEYINETNTVHNTVHYGPDGDHWTVGAYTNFVADLASGYHTYGLLWTAETLTWYVDRTQVIQIATPAEMNRPMIMLVNYAIGGSWAPTPTDPNLPGMAIDYIRAYSLDAAPLASPTQGTSGADTLAGTGGPDILTGGAGNDIYVVGIADTVVEAANGGMDTVKSALSSYTLTDNVENLTLTGAAAISGTGNALSNLLAGNSAANTLTGGGGDDTLNGGAGIDRLAGGAGNDTYVLGSDLDVVVEAAGQGIDTVTTNVNHSLAVTVENLTLTGTLAAYGYGNELANIINGNSAANRMEGRGGADTIDAGGGADTILGGAGADRLTGGTSGDSFIYNKGDGHDVITDFGNGADVLNLSSLLNAGFTPTLVLSGSDTLVQFSAADDIRLIGVLPSELTATISGFVHV